MAGVAMLLGMIATALGIVVTLGGLMQRAVKGIEGRFDEQDARLDSRLDQLEGRFDEKIDRVEERLTARIDSLERVTDTRLSALEGDMHLVKQHLLGSPSAA